VKKVSRMARWVRHRETDGCQRMLIPNPGSGDVFLRPARQGSQSNPRDQPTHSEPAPHGGSQSERVWDTK
jgi:hypothetical protein